MLLQGSVFDFDTGHSTTHCDSRGHTQVVTHWATAGAQRNQKTPAGLQAIDSLQAQRPDHPTTNGRTKTHLPQLANANIDATCFCSNICIYCATS